VHIGIACIDGQSIAAMLLEDRSKATFDFGKGIIPAYTLPLISLAYHRLADAVLVGVQFLETICFGTDIAVTEYILRITSDGEDLTPAGYDL
jgi:hypothetical protein